MDTKIIPAFVSFACFLLFAAPVTMGILNSGNAVGMFVSATLTAIFIFRKPFTDLTEKLWGKPVGKIFLCTVSVFIAACIILAALISIFMVRAMNDPPKDENTTLVVLGCKVKDGRPSLMLRRRLDAAYNYLSEHESVNVVVSGGQGADEAISEAQCMMNYLTEKGISPDRIYMEDKSVNTYENLKFSKQIIETENLPENVTLVTDGFHQLRAEMLAKKFNIYPNNISGYTSWYIVPTYWVREWFGIVFYTIFG